MSSFPDFVWCALPGLIEISSGSSNRKVLFLPSLWVTYCRKGAWISPWSKMTVFAVISGCVLIFFSLKTVYSKCKMFFFFSKNAPLPSSKHVAPFCLSFLLNVGTSISVKTWQNQASLVSRPSRKRRGVYSSRDLTNYFVCIFAKPWCHANQFVTSNRE